jgi:hypothetical protein
MDKKYNHDLDDVFKACDIIPEEYFEFRHRFEDIRKIKSTRSEFVQGIEKLIQTYDARIAALFIANYPMDIFAQKSLEGIEISGDKLKTILDKLSKDDPIAHIMNSIIDASQPKTKCNCPECAEVPDKETKPEQWN